MGLFMKKVATTDTAGVDVLQDTEVQVSSNYRRVARWGLAGSSNPADTKASLYYGGIFVSSLYNTTTAQFDTDDLRVMSQKKYLPPGMPLRVVIDDAPNADGLLVLDIQEVEPAAFRRMMGRWRGRRGRSF